jgi:uncharacterized protein YyaL (SSP411 family)
MDANRLDQETSPYLLQHKDNPVHWQPWDSPALDAAKAANRPIMLSVGYSACHWCHVMAHESFDNPAIAALVNENFVAIKVDREERPDLDTIYQQALSLMGQQGGWPLTMFLTPSGEPFWGGTYFPPVARFGRPGFPDVLRAVAKVWSDDPARVRQNVAVLTDGLNDLSRAPGSGTLSLEMLDQAAAKIAAMVDPVHGGLGGAPKFPQPGLFHFLWRSGWRSGDSSLSDAVIVTLDHLCQGGIYDHLGGGFMRYATDEQWLVPHFEKMLYDNAQLMELLTDAWKATRNPLYRSRVAETVEWLLGEMVAEGGAFAAALDADSEGEEGRFYTWTADEITSLLEPEVARWFMQAYDVRPGGNWEGRSILHRNHHDQPVDVEDVLADARAVLWRHRATRVRPGRDDKVLADWNGMMIAALARAAFTFTMPRWLDAARLAFEVIRKQMALPGNRLANSMRFGRTNGIGVLDDYAHMARAALALHQVTGEADYLPLAAGWIATANRLYWDDAEGGYFLSASDAADVILRTKPSLDSAVPAGNGVMAEVLASLHLATGEAAYRQRAEDTIAAFSAAVPQLFPNMTSLLGAYEQLAAPIQVVVAGPLADDEAGAALLQVVAESAIPRLSLLRVGDGTTLPPGHPAHGKAAVDGLPAAYVCRAAICTPPITDASRLQDTLSAR